MELMAYICVPYLANLKFKVHGTYPMRLKTLRNPLRTAVFFRVQFIFGQHQLDGSIEKSCAFY
jgi:hypothetical protein